MIKTPCCGRKCFCILFLSTALIFFFFSLALCFAFLPEQLEKDGMVENLLHVHVGRPIKEKIMDLIPDKAVPEHWTPISLEGTSRLTLCQLDFKRYSAQPYTYPMFKDLVALSRCTESGRSKTATIKGLLTEIESASGTPAGRVVYPSGFVFHESRVGSTLVANMLASDPDNMVFSESAVGASLFRRTPDVFRDVVTIMGRSPTHKRMFFKFQSKMTINMKIALQAFPDVPWIFIFRKPVEVMMSHLNPPLTDKIATGVMKLSPPCLRSRGTAASTAAIVPFLPAGNGKDIPDEAWCATYLSELCQTAISMHKQYGHFTPHDGQHSASPGGVALSSTIESSRGTRLDYSLPRGFMLDYDSLPGIFPRLLLTFLGVSVSEERFRQLVAVSAQYSKGRAWYYPKAGRFSTDSSDKKARATDEIRKWSGYLLDPAFQELSVLATASYQAVARRGEISPPLLSIGKDTGVIDDWTPLKSMPSEQTPETASSTLFTSDSNFDSKLYNPFSTSFNSSFFETVSCPATPAPDYPRVYPLPDLLNNWNPDDTTIPAVHYDSFCRFDYVKDRKQIEAYRAADVPVVITNIPEITQAVRKWSDIDYLNEKLGPYVPYLTETSKDNHFMFARGHSYKEHVELLLEGPTGVTMSTFEEWLGKAVVQHNQTLAQRTHRYFRITATTPDRHWLYDEFPFFKPDSSFFHATRKTVGKGINCRFGMKGIIAECHYDGTPNFVASVGGLRRWIMAAPSECDKLYLLQKPSTSSRHSRVDWSAPDDSKYPHFKEALANEIILKPGDMLFVPGYWFHYIVSLNVNFQCNCRVAQGGTRINRYRNVIHKCGTF